jgi:hypothetical protein
MGMGPRFTIASVLALPLWVGLTGCAEPIAAPSAFTEERFLCDAEHLAEFDAILAECRNSHLADASCSGYISFRGTIDSQPVVVDAPTTLVKFDDQAMPAEMTTRGFTLWASAPYFAVRLYILNPSLTSVQTPDASDSASNRDFMNLEVRGGNYLSAWINETREIQILTNDEVKFSFSTDLTRGGHLEGCLDVLSGTKP